MQGILQKIGKIRAAGQIVEKHEIGSRTGPAPGSALPIRGQSAASEPVTRSHSPTMKEGGVRFEAS
jgi:hypothetical protein